MQDGDTADGTPLELEGALSFLLRCRVFEDDAEDLGEGGDGVVETCEL